MTRQTLQQWAAQQPYLVQQHPAGAYWIPDSTRLVDRAGAFWLSDYLVSSVTGGTLWFLPRPDTNA